MSPDRPLIEMTGVVRSYQGLRPLRVAGLQVARRDRLALGGFDAAATEVFVHLVTGASLPEEGDVRVAGRSTRDIATDTEWLASLDRFGIVTHRAVLLEGMTLAQNLALPMTLSIEPVPPDVAVRVEALAAEAGLAAGRLGVPAASLAPAERVRAHLARALTADPELLLLEHPTAPLNEAAESEAFGRSLRAVADGRGIGWLLFTEDEALVAASGGTRLRLQPATGVLSRGGFWRTLF